MFHLKKAYKPQQYLILPSSTMLHYGVSSSGAYNNFVSFTIPSKSISILPGQYIIKNLVNYVTDIQVRTFIIQQNTTDIYLQYYSLYYNRTISVTDIRTNQIIPTSSY